MSTIEQIRQKNRKILILHIGKVVYGRNPSIDETKKVDLMLDIGYSIAEILSSLRVTAEKINEGISVVESNPPSDNNDSLAPKNEFSCMGTPLERHFHEYVNP